MRVTAPTPPLRSEGSPDLPLAGGRIDAASALSVHLVLLLVVPSNLTLAGMAAYGRPSLLWGLLLLLWWLLWRLQQRETIPGRPTQPVRVAFLCLVVVVLVSFAAALLRGQPFDQISPAISAVVRLASWAGVLLVAIDGLQTRGQIVRLVRRLAIIGGALAALGLAQFATGQSFLAWVSALPGIQFDADDTVSARGTFSRSAGTAIHPLEYVTVLIGVLPLAIVCAISHGFSGRTSRAGAIWWAPSGLITLACLVSVSRSAIVGLAVAFLASLPAMPRRFRWIALISGVVAAGLVSVAVPGMFSTVVSLFAGASDDPSTQSRTNALARLPEFMSSSPLLGAGFGTFLPRYYIFDNQWVMLLVEIGLLGTLAFAGVLIAAIWGAHQASRAFSRPEDVMLSRAVAASVIALATAYSLFDALAFPMSAGLLFLVVGFCGAIRGLALGAARSLEPAGQNRAAMRQTVR